MTDKEWRAALEAAGASGAALLHLESAHDGAVFGGFESEQEGREFDERVARHVVPGARRFSATWCCTTVHYQAGTILYKRPWPLPRGAAARGGAAAAAAAAKHTTMRRPCYWEDCRTRKPSERTPDDIG
mmetsp:Transcript_20465/g.65441  ORF Transcript_20465/g.65441 Transcript_20465/m.65441 type:complete len:129 (+) Transcript_20465:3-389(+)